MKGLSSCVRMWDPVGPNSEIIQLVITQLITIIKKALHRYNFVGFSAYDGLLSLQLHWNDLLCQMSHFRDKPEFLGSQTTLYNTYTQPVGSRNLTI